MLDKEIRKIKYITEDEADIKAGAIDSKTRKREVVLARMVLSNFLMVEVGLKEETLQRYIKRDRTSFYHYQQRHETYMEDKRIYPEYNDLYTRVKLRYYTLDERLFDGVHKNEKVAKLSKVEENIKNLERQRVHLETEITILS